ncbi:MAG: hypothetical protein HRT54_21345 [Colwellia sp.]|nr:hypothetical protein [Colwellia sp.]
MKLIITLYISLLTITACSNTLSHQQKLIEAEFTHSENNVVYSELVDKTNEHIKNIKGSHKNENFTIKIVRTTSLNNKQIRQSSHSLNADIKAGMKYHVSTSITNDKLNVWIIDSATLAVVSTVSTINTVFEKVFTLKEMTKDKVKRIKIILNNKQDEIAHLSVINKRKPRYTWD